MKICKAHWISPLGGITMASDGQSLTGLWFDGQKYFGAGMNLDAAEDVTAAVDVAASEDIIEETNSREASNLRAAADISSFGNLYEESSNYAQIFTETVRWLTQYFAGRKPDYLPPLNPAGSDFRKKVWKILLTIPYGEMMSYGQIAAQIAAQMDRKTMSAQAVGGAVGHNPISILIPCHRVIGGTGSLTGYAGGIERKMALLKLEGVDDRMLSVPLKGSAL